jgi:ankyrin repeat protein
MPCELSHLIDALHQNSLESVQLCLLDGYPAGKVMSHSLNSALHHAAMYEDVEITQSMIDTGAQSDVFAKNLLWRTPFHIAAQEGNKDVALLLIAHGSDFEQVDKHGKTPKKLAIENGRMEMAAIFDSLLACKQVDQVLVKSKSGIPA